MTFKLACGDVMPGCAAVFEDTDQDHLLGSVAEHAAAEHGLTEISPEVLDVVKARVVAV